MYIDYDTEQRDMTNRVYDLTEDIKTLCCSYILEKGSQLRVVRYTSKNRLLVETYGKNASLHKIKRSNLNRVGKEIINE